MCSRLAQITRTAWPMPSKISVRRCLPQKPGPWILVRSSGGIFTLVSAAMCLRFCTSSRMGPRKKSIPAIFKKVAQRGLLAPLERSQPHGAATHESLLSDHGSWLPIIVPRQGRRKDLFFTRRVRTGTRTLDPKQDLRPPIAEGINSTNVGDWQPLGNSSSHPRRISSLTLIPGLVERSVRNR